MKTLKITSANFYNNAQAKLNINLSDGTTMCANVLDSDKISYIAKGIDLYDLVDKYYHKEGEKYRYSNPTK